MAITTRRVVLSLFAGILAGTGIMACAHPAAYVGDGGSWLGLPSAVVAATFRQHLWPSLIQEEKLAVFAFTLLMGAMVGIIQRAGGMRGLVDAVARWANNVRRAQVAAWLLGLIVFFDDYANTLLLGGTLKPLFDRLKISREKLAYIVDSTAAPVSGLALISTWVAGEINYVRDGLLQLPDVNWDPLELFLGSIPFRFYVIWALLLVPIAALLGRDFRSMAAAESRARRVRDGHDRSVSANQAIAGSVRPSHWINALLPIAVTVGAIVILMYRSGWNSAEVSELAASERSLMQIFGHADTFMSLLWGSLIGACAAGGMAWIQGLLSFDAIQKAAAEGALHMAPALGILWLASALSAMTGSDSPPHPLPFAETASSTMTTNSAAATQTEYPHLHQRLYTGDYLGGLLQNRMPPWLAPTIVFVLSGAIAFATGTSWGTMGIVMPLAMGTAYRLLATGGATPAADDPVLLGCIGGVLAGAIFGDHCSPISDTTVMSSQACGCSHVDHVQTQLPYAMLVGVVSVVFGTLPIGLGISPWIMLPIGLIALVAAMWCLGKKPDLGDAA